MARDFLSKQYNEVELFDQCSTACEDAETNNLVNNNVYRPKKCRMQDYSFEENEKLNGIYLRWCIGYLKREEQIKFLKKAKQALDNNRVVFSRRTGPPSYIILLDNVDDQVDRKNRLMIDKQEVQTEEYYEKLFIEADLTIFK